MDDDGWIQLQIIDLGNYMRTCPPNLIVSHYASSEHPNGGVVSLNSWVFVGFLSVEVGQVQ